jgi:hypothetical protein
MTITAAILGVVNTALAFLIAFGVDLTQEQTGAITAVVNAVLVLAALVYDRWHGTTMRSQIPSKPTP